MTKVVVTTQQFRNMMQKWFAECQQYANEEVIEVGSQEDVDGENEGDKEREEDKERDERESEDRESESDLIKFKVCN